MSFQKKIGLVALFVLVVMLSLVAYLLYKTNKNVVFPPTIAQCPDYWEVTGEGTCNNIKNLGKGCENPMDFSGSKWQGDSGLRAKYCWARQCGLTWDGVTNNSKVANGANC